MNVYLYWYRWSKNPIPTGTNSNPEAMSAWHILILGGDEGRKRFIKEYQNARYYGGILQGDGRTRISSMLIVGLYWYIHE